jgi:hypothetical protein
MIKRFSEFMSSMRINEAKNVTFNELEKLDKMKSIEYIKNVMWNHSILLFYGRDYKGNPETDRNMIPSVSASDSSKDISMGDVFKDAWEETDNFCKRANYKFVFSFGNESFSERIQKTITELDSNIIMEWITKTSIAVSKSDPSVFVVPTTLEDSAKKLSIEASRFFQKRTIKVDSLVSNCAKRIADREANIKKIKSELESNIDSNFDFEPDWGLDSWLKYVTEMPGWGKVYQVEANKIGYWYTWTLAATVADLTEIKFGVAILKAIQSMIKSGKINLEGVDASKVTPVQTTTDQINVAPIAQDSKPSTKPAVAQKQSATKKYAEVSLK